MVIVLILILLFAVCLMFPVLIIPMVILGLLLLPVLIFFVPAWGLFKAGGWARREQDRQMQRKLVQKQLKWFDEQERAQQPDARVNNASNDADDEVTKKFVEALEANRKDSRH